MVKPFLYYVANGRVKYAERIYQSNGHGVRASISITPVFRPISGRSLYAAMSIPHIKDLKLSRHHGMPFEKQCNAKQAGGLIWRSLSVTPTGQAYLIFTACHSPLLQLWAHIFLIPSKI